MKRAIFNVTCKQQVAIESLNAGCTQSTMLAMACQNSGLVRNVYIYIYSVVNRGHNTNQRAEFQKGNPSTQFHVNVQCHKHKLNFSQGSYVLSHQVTNNFTYRDISSHH